MNKNIILSYSIDIQNLLRTVASGEFDGKVGVNETWAYQGQPKTYQKIIATVLKVNVSQFVIFLQIRSNPLTFVVGVVPMTISATVPITVGYQYQAEAQATLVPFFGHFNLTKCFKSI